MSSIARMTAKSTSSAALVRAHMLSRRAFQAHLTRATVALSTTKGRTECAALRVRIADLSAHVAAL